MNNKTNRIKKYVGVVLAIIGIILFKKSVFGALFIIVAGLLCVIYNNKKSIYVIVGVLLLGIFVILLDKPAYYGKFRHCEKNVCEIIKIDKDYFYMFNGKKYKYSVSKKKNLSIIDVDSAFTFSYDKGNDILCYVGNTECMYEYSRYNY